MPITSDQLGPGNLILGSGPLDVSLQVTACKVTASEQVTTREAKKVLGGEELPGSESVSFTYALEGTFLQDLIAAGVVTWSWVNAGTEQAVTFVPNTARGRQVQGIIKPVPLTIGGDEVEGEDLTSDFTWRFVGTPDWEAVI